MAEYGLLCAKLRDEGLGVVAEVIEKLQAERDLLKRERARLLEISIFCCEDCKHYSNQGEGCELDEHDCSECSRKECYCRECVGGCKWEWKGLEESGCDTTQQNNDN